MGEGWKKTERRLGVGLHNLPSPAFHLAPRQEEQMGHSAQGSPTGVFIGQTG